MDTTDWEEWAEKHPIKNWALRVVMLPLTIPIFLILYLEEKKS